MDSGLLNQEELMHGNLRKQLAVAVRSIQWSYAIFWSFPSKQQGTLEWTDGYYNGDIKTRKTMQPMELNVDNLGLKRSEQLKELYGCLEEGEANEQAKRPSASLSPEDLSDAEWYYLVCMSFTFAPGVGLPGRAFASGQHIWLCNAQYADSKIFTRSLLAKSASIQTVVCFPLLGGVIELGVTDLVMEDLNLLQHIKTVFLEFPKYICSDNFASNLRKDDNDEDPISEIGHEVIDTMAFEKFNPVLKCGMQTEVGDQVFPYSLSSFTPEEEFEFAQNSFKEVQANVCEEMKADSVSDCSDGGDTNQQTEDSFMVDGVNGVSSQVQSWQFMDDDFSNCVPISMNSSDCISQTYFNPDKHMFPLKKENADSLQGFNHTKFSMLGIGTNDLHYTKTLSVILGNSNHLMQPPCSNNDNQQSSFSVWKNGSLVTSQKPPQSGTPQKALKKILFEVPLMYSDSPIKSKKDIGDITGHGRDDTDSSHFLADKKELLNDPFLVLRSLVPSITKVDKASLLGDTIEYLKNLERRVEELESRGRQKLPDTAEKTSDSCHDKTPQINKRKACDIDEIDPELDWVSPKDGPAGEISVCIDDKEAAIEIHVPWRECLLLEILDAISNLQLDAHSVQSSTTDGILSLTLKSKFRGIGLVTVGMIKSAIETVVAMTPS
ncbi:transcription factor [Ranunculus cassubicifolius]